jgi:hypothetical protein
MVTPPMPSIAYSDRWHETIPERQRQRQLEREQVQQHYDNQKRERDDRENDERRIAQGR